jgi:hypothetical protein
LWLPITPIITSAVTGSAGINIDSYNLKGYK